MWFELATAADIRPKTRVVDAQAANESIRFASETAGYVERILVISDDPESPRAVRGILEKAGYDVTVAACGPIAMDVFRTAEPGLVVLDGLPGTLIQDLCRQIRDKSGNVPLLVLSTISDVEHVVLLLQLGADGYITKPFSTLEFLARVRAAMRLSEHVVGLAWP